MRFPRSLAAGAVPTQGTVPPPGAAWVCWGRLPLPLGVTAVRPPFLNSGPASPSGRLAGHRHGLKFVWVPLTVDPWYPAGRPGACSPAGGFEVLLGGCVAPPRGAWRNTPDSPCGSWPSCLRRLPLSFALWWPLLAAPPPPHLLQAHPSAAVAPPLTVSSQARSRHAGAGVTPRDLHASPHVQLRPAQERPKVILLLYTEASQCPLGAHLPPPQQSPSRPLGALDPPQGPDPRMRGGHSRTRHRGRHFLPSRTGAAGDTPLRGGDARGAGAASDPAATAGLCRARQGACGGRYSE